MRVAALLPVAALALLCPKAIPAQETAALLEGVVRYLGPIPRASAPDNDGHYWPLLSVHADTAALQSAVVYLEGAPPVRDQSQPFPLRSIDQIDFVFNPRVLAVRVGQDVSFTNSDSENHNVHSVAKEKRNQFNIATGPGLEYDRDFAPEPNGAPVMLTCDIHSWMRGWIYTFDHPYFAVTNAQGRFTITAPPGDYRLIVRQPDGRMRHERAITLSAQQATAVTIEFSDEDLGKDGP